MKKFYYTLLLNLALAGSALFTQGYALSQDIIMFNGGISEDERALAPNSGTRLSFFLASGGSYLSEVSVRVRDQDGNEIVDTLTEGPWLVLDLPPGRYQVIATRKSGEAQSLVIDVTESSQEFGFGFP